MVFYLKCGGYSLGVSLLLSLIQHARCLPVENIGSGKPVCTEPDKGKEAKEAQLLKLCFQ